MGGVFVECNQLFCQLSEYTKKELCSMTLFNLTARADLQNAFDRLSSMISSPANGLNSQQSNPLPILLRGTMKNRQDLGISVAMIREDGGIPNCFLVTLLKDVPQETIGRQPMFASFDCVRQQTTIYVWESEEIKRPVLEGIMPPTFTTG